MSAVSSPTGPRVAILGAGPIGLDAALACSGLGLPFTLYEAADRVADSVRSWQHVRLFSPWPLDVSPRMRRALAEAGLAPPEDEDRCPTGRELLERVLEPVAALPAIAPRLRLGHRVVAVSRAGHLKSSAIFSGARRHSPFRLLLEDREGRELVEGAEVVLDCTGSHALPNPAGDGGLPAPGERALVEGEQIVHEIPDLGCSAERWGGRRILLVGAGHSAQTAARDLARLAEHHPGTRVLWALRRSEPRLDPVPDDPLPERAEITGFAHSLLDGHHPAVEVRPGTVIERFDVGGDTVRVTLRSVDASEPEETVAVDRVLCLTGRRGDLGLFRELQVHLCYATEGPMKLAASLLGEEGGDCLAQESQGVETLLNPEWGFFVLGSKSYARNATFLLRTGWQQVDEVTGWLAEQDCAEGELSAAAPAS